MSSSNPSTRPHVNSTCSNRRDTQWATQVERNPAAVYSNTTVPIITWRETKLPAQTIRVLETVMRSLNMEFRATARAVRREPHISGRANDFRVRLDIFVRRVDLVGATGHPSDDVHVPSRYRALLLRKPLRRGDETCRITEQTKTHNQMRNMAIITRTPPFRMPGTRSDTVRSRSLDSRRSSNCTGMGIHMQNNGSASSSRSASPP